MVVPQESVLTVPMIILKMVEFVVWHYTMKPVLTCLGNDFGFEFIFSKQIEFHAREGDVLIAISSSGRSADILRGVEVAKAKGMYVCTFSGFSDDNPLRKTGDLNWYVASGEYGFVKLAHQILIHCALDNKQVLEGNDR